MQTLSIKDFKKRYTPKPNESLVAPCEKCGMYRIIDKEKDLSAFSQDAGFEWRDYKCLCGQPFSIRD